MGTKTDHKQKVWRSILTDAPKIMGGTFSKKGTFTIKTLRKYTFGLPDAAEELSLAVNRRRTRPQERQAKSRT